MESLGSLGLKYFATPEYRKALSSLKEITKDSKAYFSADSLGQWWIVSEKISKVTGESPEDILKKISTCPKSTKKQR